MSKNSNVKVVGGIKHYKCPECGEYRSVWSAYRNSCTDCANQARWLSGEIWNSPYREHKKQAGLTVSSPVLVLIIFALSYGVVSGLFYLVSWLISEF